MSSTARYYFFWANLPPRFYSSVAVEPRLARRGGIIVTTRAAENLCREPRSLRRWWPQPAVLEVEIPATFAGDNPTQLVALIAKWMAISIFMFCPFQKKRVQK